VYAEKFKHENRPKTDSDDEAEVDEGGTPRRVRPSAAGPLRRGALVTLLVCAPPSRGAEREYAVSTVLGLLGLEFRLASHDRPVWTIKPTDGSAGEIVLPDTLLGIPDREWLQTASLPVQPIRHWQPADQTAEPLPALYGATDTAPESSGGYSVPIDLFGSAFFMLTRYEERVLGYVDSHGRFPAHDSVSFRDGFVTRAIVHEYADALWTSIACLWPGVKRQRRPFRISVTHDVDWMLSVRQAPGRVLRLVCGDLLRRRDIELFTRRTAAALRYGAGRPETRDPVETFDFIMSTSEKHGLTSAFYFLADAARLDAVHNDTYSLTSPDTHRLLRSINARGHEIGLHGSYQSHGDPEQLAREANLLRAAAATAGVAQESWGGRQHFLRFTSPATWAAWDAAGMAYDSSVGYAEAPGFRCGMADEFPVFDLDARRTLALIERPLIAMEGSFLDGQYLGERPKVAVRRILDLARTCKRHGGMFTLLWHNSSLARRVHREAYESVLAALHSG
jgi:hypothetical protein